MFIVAGVSGHVGAVAAHALLKKGHKIKVIVRDAQKGTSWSKEGAEVAVGSLADQAFLTSTLKGAKGFFTLLPPDFTGTDIFAGQKKTADVIAAAVKDSGVPHVVLLSSIGADLHEGTGPIKGLHYLENALRKTGTQLTAIRAGSFQENIGQAIGAAKHMGIYPDMMSAPDYPMPMIATHDIGMLAAESLMAPAGKSEIVDLHGPAYSVRQLAAKLEKALDKKLEIVAVPPEGHVSALEKAGLPKHVAASYAEMYSGFASGKIAPRGDRMVQGKTEIDTVISGMLKA